MRQKRDGASNAEEEADEGARHADERAAMKAQPHYSGVGSKGFWSRVKALRGSEGDVCYALGCALQDLEHRTLARLASAEALQQKGRTRPSRLRMPESSR